MTWEDLFDIIGLGCLIALISSPYWDVVISAVCWELGSH